LTLLIPLPLFLMMLKRILLATQCRPSYLLFLLATSKLAASVTQVPPPAPVTQLRSSSCWCSHWSCYCVLKMSRGWSAKLARLVIPTKDAEDAVKLLLRM
jgi:hypothetical protein